MTCYILLRIKLLCNKNIKKSMARVNTKCTIYTLRILKYLGKVNQVQEQTLCNQEFGLQSYRH